MLRNNMSILAAYILVISEKVHSLLSLVIYNNEVIDDKYCRFYIITKLGYTVVIIWNLIFTFIIIIVV